MKIDIFEHQIIKPFAYFGLTNKFWEINLDTLIYTWGGMIFLFILAIIGRYAIKRDPNIVSMAYEKTINFLIGSFSEAFKHFNFNYFTFTTSIFLFTLFSSIIGVFPLMDEATKDLNTTLAIATTSFFYIQCQKIKVHGISGYLREFIEPIFILLPIHVVGELAKIASMSFRLFGNILGGGIISTMILLFVGTFKIYFLIYMFILTVLKIIIWKKQLKYRHPYLLSLSNFALNIVFLISWVQIFFGIFEGLIQSFVITMLSTTYLAIGVQKDEDYLEELV